MLPSIYSEAEKRKIEKYLEPKSLSSLLGSWDLWINVAIERFLEGPEKSKVSQTDHREILRQSRTLMTRIKKWCVDLNEDPWAGRLQRKFIDDDRLGDAVEGLWKCVHIIEGAIEEESSSLPQKKGRPVKALSDEAASKLIHDLVGIFESEQFGPLSYMFPKPYKGRSRIKFIKACLRPLRKESETIQSWHKPGSTALDKQIDRAVEKYRQKDIRWQKISSRPKKQSTSTPHVPFLPFLYISSLPHRKKR